MREIVLRCDYHSENWAHLPLRRPLNELIRFAFCSRKNRSCNFGIRLVRKSTSSDCRIIGWRFWDKILYPTVCTIFKATVSVTHTGRLTVCFSQRTSINHSAAAAEIKKAWTGILFLSERIRVKPISTVRYSTHCRVKRHTSRWKRVIMTADTP